MVSKEITPPSPQSFREAFVSFIPYSPNTQQSLVIGALERFCLPVAMPRDSTPSADHVFILAGYAGTGKTSLTGALVKTLNSMGIKTVLMAPTGRAAKVFGAYAKSPAYTIHRKIYRHSVHGEIPSLQQNNFSNTIFIVDEASMIGGDMNSFGSSLLEDLIHYVFAGTDNRLIFLGDTAQLPPVGCSFSPAMEPDALRSFGLKVSKATLTATVRQQAGSGILANATALRRDMASGNVSAIPKIITRGYSDIAITPPDDLPEIIEQLYRRDGIENTLLITRSNKRATAFNKAIREQILYLDTPLAPGEQILVAKNNYFWSRNIKGLDFIANGDIAIVKSINAIERRYGFTFADVSLLLPDRDAAFDAKVFINTLSDDFAALPQSHLQHLFDSIMADPQVYPPNTPPSQQVAFFRNNPYWNALQVKFAYAVTCHKAQGGQWKNVLVDMGYIHPEAAGLELYRWLYTAFTRTTGSLTIIESALRD